MSDEITTEIAELDEVTTLGGVLMVDLAGLPPGSLVTLTVRVGPETPPAPDAVTETPRAYMGRRINTP